MARASVVLLEGYLWDVPAAKEAMRHAAATAHASEGSVALSLSDPFCVGRHQREFLDLLLDDVDILLGNEEELTMLFGAVVAKAAVAAAEETGLLVVMTRGAQGAVVLDRPRARRGAGRPGGPAWSTRPVQATSSPPASSSASPTAWAPSRAPGSAGSAPPRSSPTPAPAPRPT